MGTDVRHATARQTARRESPGPGRTPRAGRTAGLLAFSIALLLAATADRALAKSMYVIASIINFDAPIPINVYDIGSDGRLTFQAQFGAPFIGAGMRGIAMDSDSGHLFCTYENSGFVLVVDATTLQRRDVLSVDDAVNLAGIVYDHEKKLLYCAELGTGTLYVMAWDSLRGKFTPVVGSPFTLKDAQMYGIALDEYDDLLYVASPDPGIGVYSTWDWSLVRTLPVTRVALSIAVDPQRDCLYYGGGFADNFYLTQCRLSDWSVKDVQVDPEAGVMGLGVDPDTGLIYVTTGRDNRPGGKDLMVFDTDLKLLQTIPDIGRPTGLVVPPNSTSFNPLHLVKKVKNPLGGKPNDQGQYYVVIGDQVTYTICFDDGGYNLSGVFLVDRLPAELTFVSATGHGTFGRYDAATHTYRWENPPMTAGVTTCLELVCQLQPQTPAGQVVTNRVTIDTDQTPPSTVSCSIVATEATYNPLNVRKIVVSDTGEDESTAYASPGGEVTYRIYFDNLDNNYATADIVIVDTLPEQIEFVSASDDGVYGVYDGAAHAYTWTYPSLAGRASASVDLVGRLSDKLMPGTIVTNRVMIKSSETPEVSKGTDLTVAYPAIEIEKTVVGAIAEKDDRGRPCVGAGDKVTYAIVLHNPSREIAATEVKIVDELPPELTFINAEGDRDFGSYDSATRTFTWRQPLLTAGGEFGVKLVAQVKDSTPAGTVIGNVVTVTSKQTVPGRARAEVVLCTGSVQGEMFLKPTRLWRNQSKAAQDLMVTVHLPQGYGKDKIVDTPLILTPGNVPSGSLRIFGTGEQGKILCFFDTAAILAAIEGGGEIPIQVTGKLQGGRSFVCDGTITIVEYGDRDRPKE